MAALSITDAIFFAPSLIKALVPDDFPLIGDEGTAKISFPCSNPNLAVIKEPELTFASTTKTAELNDATNLLRRGKFDVCGFVPSKYSETNAPCSHI